MVSKLLSAKRGVELLSAREREVFVLMGHGYAVKEIATKLKIDPKTIYTYRGRICDKLKVADSTDLLCSAIVYVIGQEGSGG